MTASPIQSPDAGTIIFTISARVRTLRENRALSLQQLADRAGITKAHVWTLEQGHDCNPTIRTIVALAGALAVPVADLLGLDGERP